MGISRKFTLLRSLFPETAPDGIDHHLMEVYQMDYPSLNELKTFQPNEYRKIRDEELMFLGKSAL